MNTLRRFFCNVFLRTLFRFKISGRDHLPPASMKGILLAGNHAGFLDGLMVVAAYPQRVRFLVKEEVLSWPFAGKIVARINPIVVRQGKEILAIREALRTIAAGKTVCIFPEGKLSTDGELAEFREGLALLAKKSGAPIVPFTLMGSFSAWGWAQKRPKLFARLGIHFHKAVSFQTSTNVTDTVKSAILTGYAA